MLIPVNTHFKNMRCSILNRQGFDWQVVWYIVKTRDCSIAKYDAYRTEFGQMSMLTCPHCRQPTKYSFADEFDRVDAGRFICGNCKKEFFALNNVAMTEREFQANLESLRRARAYAS